MATLSDRMFNSVTDLLDQSFESNTVQKLLLTGDQSPDGKTAFQKVFRAVNELKGNSDKNVKIMQSIDRIS